MRFVSALIIVACLLTTGCGRQTANVVVSGMVRFEGTPLGLGEIRFVPQAGTNAPTNGCLIRDGRYSVTARGGLLPGKYRVEIESRSTTGKELAMPEEGEGPPKPPIKIPARYNSKSTLEAEIGPEPLKLTLDYDLTAK